MQRVLCRVKEGDKEIFEEVSKYVGYYTFLCCGKEISLKIMDRGEVKSCKNCGKKFFVKKEGYIIGE